MSTQPKALFLADVIDKDFLSKAHHDAAAAELRRLHEENAELRKANDAFGQRQEWWNERMVALEAQRDALLEALKQSLEEAIYPSKMLSDVYEKARAAIKMAKEGK